jgi:tripartite-type tricarboxylate transporter receptor subunit TctC
MQRVLAALSLAVAALAAQQVLADDVADFYKGKRINLIVGYGPGGGYDSNARVLARYLPKYIPGHPAIVVQNMPGAGSIRATNFIYNVAPRDGTTIGTFGRNAPLLGVIRTSQNVQYDPAKFTWLGSMSSFANDGYILVVRKDAQVKSIDDARRPGGPPLILGSSAEGSSSDSSAILMRDMLGFNVKLIPGYTDGGMLFVAIERGEIDGRAMTISTLRANRADWLKPDGPVRVLVVFGRETRHPDFPDIPTARELVRSDEDRNVLDVAESSYKLNRPYAGPPGVPAERARALQDAFMAAQKDLGYLQEARKLGLDVSPINASEIMRLIERISRMPPDQLARVERLIADSR